MCKNRHNEISPYRRSIKQTNAQVEPFLTRFCAEAKQQEREQTSTTTDDRSARHLEEEKLLVTDE